MMNAAELDSAAEEDGGRRSEGREWDMQQGQGSNLQRREGSVVKL
jgi:hypothetical protein